MILQAENGISVNDFDKLRKLRMKSLDSEGLGERAR